MLTQVRTALARAQRGDFGTPVSYHKGCNGDDEECGGRLFVEGLIDVGMLRPTDVIEFDHRPRNGTTQRFRYRISQLGGFPVVEALAAAFYLALAQISYESCLAHARRIVALNDRGDFDAAWNAVAAMVAEYEYVTGEASPAQPRSEVPDGLGTEFDHLTTPAPALAGAC